jgi:hypothetical protein
MAKATELDAGVGFDLDRDARRDREVVGGGVSG